MQFDINILAVLVAAIASTVIGAAWYSPFLFGKLWMSLSGLTPEKLEEVKKKGVWKSYTLSFIAALVMAYVLSLFLRQAGTPDISVALQLGFFLWLGFIATTMLNRVLWEDEPWVLYALNVGHHLVSILVMAVILTFLV